MTNEKKKIKTNLRLTASCWIMAKISLPEEAAVKSSGRQHGPERLEMMP